MTGLSLLTAQLAAGRELDAGEARAAAQALAMPDVPDADKAAFLTAFADKGETAAEVAAFAAVFRTLALNPGVEAWARQAIDIVGTGGDHLGGFNVSSVVTLVLACAGVPVMKHGNRGITSKCGSADLMAALGIDLAAPPEKLRRALPELGFVFFFAPNYHPAFKHVAAVRKALAGSGRRTVFNFIGPLINPGRPAHVLLGTFSEPWALRLAATLETLGASAGLAVVGVIDDGRGIDELTTASVNRVRGFGRLATVDGHWRAGDFGLRQAPFTEIQGGDVAANVALVDAILAGRGPAGLVDTIVLNAAVALWIVGRTAEVADGIAHARDLLLGGAVKAKIAATGEFYRS
ncbi:MAG TPA: anthranilate phosphoribosyltransferase [Opitutaceae bacterium]|nr:anthranilate phosphoribosyltransferase [Opitutaceae bacterium]